MRCKGCGEVIETQSQCSIDAHDNCAVFVVQELRKGSNRIEIREKLEAAVKASRHESSQKQGQGCKRQRQAGKGSTAVGRAGEAPHNEVSSLPPCKMVKLYDEPPPLAAPPLPSSMTFDETSWSTALAERADALADLLTTPSTHPHRPSAPESTPEAVHEQERCNECGIRCINIHSTDSIPEIRWCFPAGPRYCCSRRCLLSFVKAKCNWHWQDYGLNTMN